MDDRRVRDLGEFALIDALAEALPPGVREGGELALGIGDDAAVWRPAPGAAIVLTTDTLVEGVHFRLDWTDWQRLGQKALAVNISDLAAMGATPRLALVTLGLRGDERLVDLRALYEGIGEVARRFGVRIAGGDIVRSPRALTLHISALGEAAGGRVLTRSGAQPGDVIGVTGTLGAAAAGMEILGLTAADRRRAAATAALLVEAHRNPQPRVTLGKVLLEEGATAAMDLSDGLLGDLPKILAASGVASEVDARRIPVAAAVRALFPENWLDLALRGGEDYELLFTLPPQRWPDLCRAVEEAGGVATAIGTIVSRPAATAEITLVDLDGRAGVIAPGAFDHFGQG